MSYRSRRMRKHAVGLDITAFMNLIVVLVPFLLSSTVFSRLAILELNLPASASGPASVTEGLQLEIIIRPNALEVSDRNHGLIRRIDNNASGYNYPALSRVLQQVKTQFPDKNAATILSEYNTAYDTLVQVMDTVRVAGDGTAMVELFPDISIGDAPAAGASVPQIPESAPTVKRGQSR